MNPYSSSCVNDMAVNELTRPFDDDHFINMANLTISGL